VFDSYTQPGVRLAQLLADAQLQGCSDLSVTSCSSDSRSVKPGDLFAALLGTQCDGHDYIAEARDRGAAALLVERPVPSCGLPVCLVPDTRDAYGQVCQALAGLPSQSVKTIGITGTNGKTTTAALTASVLNAGGASVATSGTLGQFDGFDRTDTTHTTPPSPMLANWLARSAANGCSHAVMEVSSHALSQRRTAGIEYDAACFTNFRHDHLDYHNTLESYHRTKKRLLEQVSPDGLVVLNADDPVCRELLEEIDNPALTIGMQHPAEITATVLERSVSEQTFLLSIDSENAVVRTEMIGDHHIYNCLSAAALGFAYGIDLPTIVRGLELAGQVPGRLQRIECGQPFSVFVDYCHTPDAMQVVLSTLRQVTQGRLICVFGAGGDRDRAKRPEMARATDQIADQMILTSDNPRTEDVLQIINDLCQGLREDSPVEIELDRAAAIGRALGEAEEGDTVLIAGKGHEAYQLVGNQRYYHDDSEVVRDVLYQRAALESTLLAEGV